MLLSIVLLSSLAVHSPSAHAFGRKAPPHPACQVPVKATSGAENPVALPMRLSDTGLHAPGVREYQIPYPLWTDGALKRRFIHLPQGGVICTENMDRWRYPVGTRIWKEFAFNSRPVETRLMVKNPDGSWSYGTYVWSGDQEKDARLSQGYPTPIPIGGGQTHTPPSTYDCRTCHEQNQNGQRAKNDPVLGFDALQLSEGGYLDAIAREGLLSHPPLTAPVILARTPTERRALGMLHANCGHCHNPTGYSGFTKLHFRYAFQGLSKREEAPTFKTGLRESWGGTRYLEPGQPDRSYAYMRVASGSMPALGITRPDPELVALLHAWITELR